MKAHVCSSCGNTITEPQSRRLYSENGGLLCECGGRMGQTELSAEAFQVRTTEMNRAKRNWRACVSFEVLFVVILFVAIAASNA
jgi:hypothetical protein